MTIFWRYWDSLKTLKLWVASLRHLTESIYCAYPNLHFIIFHFILQVQPHLKKCFDNIKSLKMAKVKKKRIEILFFVIIYDRGRLIERTMVSRFVTLLTLFAWLPRQMGITQKTEAVGMFSAEGEFVEFGHSVLLEGPVEVWTELILVATPIISPITGHCAIHKGVAFQGNLTEDDPEYFRSST